MDEPLPPTEDVRLAVTAALSADRHVLVLDADNRALDDWVPVADAVRGDLPFFVTALRANVLALDIDDRSSGIAEELYLELRLAGHMPVMFASGGVRESGAGVHLFCVLPSVHECEKWRAQCRAQLGDDEVSHNEVRRAVRPPWAMHRRGLSRSTPVLPAGADEVLARLVEPQVATPLDERMRALVESGELGGSDRSTALFCVALALCRRGWNEAEVLLLFTTPAFEISAVYESRRADRNHREHEWFTRHVWPEVTRIAATTDENARRRVCQIRTYWTRQILQRTTDRRSIPTDFKVMEAFLQTAENLGRLSVGMSYRQLGELAGLAGHGTVVDSVQRLREAGLIARDLAAGFRDRSEGELFGTAMARRYLLDPAGRASESESETDRYEFLLGETFRNGSGLGGGAAVVYEMLVALGGRATTEDISANAGMSVRTARRHLERLSNEGGLLARNGPHWVLTDKRPHDGMIETASAAARRDRVRHEMEREAFNEHVRHSS